MRQEHLSDMWWLAPAPAPSDGLSDAQAAARRASHGPNLLRARPAHSALRQYLNHFRNPLVLILLAASAASALTGEFASFYIVGAIVLSSVSLDFIQEYRAGRAAQALAASVAVRALVLRDGRRTAIAQSDVVPGDVALLSAGDLVPADARLLAANDFIGAFTVTCGATSNLFERPRSNLLDQSDWRAA